MQHIVHDKCPVCGSTRIRHDLKCRDHLVSGMIFPVDKCLDCGFGFTQRIPSGDVMGTFYKSENYISHTDTRRGIVNQLYHRVRSIMLTRKQKLIEQYSREMQGKLLDIGCGTGYFIGHMQQAGWEVHGAEPDPDARKLAEKRVGQPLSDVEELFRLAGDSVDVVTMWHVLEHVDQPAAYLEQIHSLLRAGGYFFAAVPNHLSYDARIYKEHWAAYDVPRHLWHFSPEAIRKLTESHGFRLVGKHRMPFDSFYVSILSEKNKDRSFGLFLGAINGGVSYLQSLINIDKSSSLVYIFKKR
ncbi:MAG: methyltransferase domain-containing protein [Solitalea sp.]